MNDTPIFRVMDILRCPKCLGKMEMDNSGSHLICEKDCSHIYPITDGIPSFVRRKEISPEDALWVFEYDETAEEYDEAVKLYSEWLGVDMKKEALKVLRDVPVKPSSRILDVSTGTGNVIFLLRELHPEIDCEFVGIDLSIGMLHVAQRKLSEADIAVPLFHTQVMKLPFEDGSFDIVTHAGGVNTFSEIPAALREWIRVLKPNGFLFIGDEGVSPALRKTRRGADIISRNKLFGLQPPLKRLPPQVKNISLSWWAGDTFYAMSCHKLSEEEMKDIRPLKLWFTVER